MKSFKFEGARSRFSHSRMSMGSEKLAPIVSHERNRSMQTLMTAGKDQFRSIDAATSKKLFGNLSISDVARAQDKSFGEQFGVSGYEIHPKNRFNFQRDHKVPQQKMKRFIDEIIEKSKKTPASNHYSSNKHKKDFFDPSKKSKIYTGDRKSAI